MNRDSGLDVSLLKVDGGMTGNNLLMQLQTDLTGISVGQCNYSLKLGHNAVISNLPSVKYYYFLWDMLYYCDTNLVYYSFEASSHLVEIFVWKFEDTDQPHVMFEPQDWILGWILNILHNCQSVLPDQQAWQVSSYKALHQQILQVSWVSQSACGEPIMKRYN